MERELRVDVSREMLNDLWGVAAIDPVQELAKILAEDIAQFRQQITGLEVCRMVITFTGTGD